MTLEETLSIFNMIGEPKVYYKNGNQHGVMVSIIASDMRTVYAMSIDDRFTLAMLRDIALYMDEPEIDLCLITDQDSEFNRLRTLLEERYNFICTIADGVMYSFYFKK